MESLTTWVEAFLSALIMMMRMLIKSEICARYKKLNFNQDVSSTAIFYTDNAPFHLTAQ